MPIDQLANYAEVFGAIAVIVSLLYVAMQIRANTREQRHRARYDQFEIQTSVYNMISDADTAQLFLKANQDYESLSDEERIRFGTANLKSLHAFHLVMEMRDDGLIDDFNHRLQVVMRTNISKQRLECAFASSNLNQHAPHMFFCSIS